MSDLAPAFYELLTLFVMLGSGIGLSGMLRVREPIVALAAGFLMSVVVRIASVLLSWNLGIGHLHAEIWWAASIFLIVLALVLLRKNLRGLRLSALLGLALSIVAIASKYVLEIGERHHSDSAQYVSLALVAIQPDNQQFDQLSGAPNRGLSYPILLALGPSERIFSALTPMIFLLGALTAAYLIKALVRTSWSDLRLWIVLGVIVAFSLSVPIFRVSMFYLNGHTLVGLSLLVLMLAFVQFKEAGPRHIAPYALTAAGGVVVATTRIEGIVFAAALFIFMVGKAEEFDLRHRVALGLSMLFSPIYLTWWLASVNSDALDHLRLNPVAIVVAPTIALLLALLPQLDKWRRYFPLIFLMGAILINFIQITRSASPVNMVSAQIPNLLLGAGGWGTAALVLVASLAVIGWSTRSSDYRELVLISATLIAATFLAKSFEGGGFGREGFNDSVNRMWMHSMWVFATTVSLGYFEVLRDSGISSLARSSGSGPNHRLTGRKNALVSKGDV